MGSIIFIVFIVVFVVLRMAANQAASTKKNQRPQTGKGDIPQKRPETAKSYETSERVKVRPNVPKSGSGASRVRPNVPKNDSGASRVKPNVPRKERPGNRRPLSARDKMEKSREWTAGESAEKEDILTAAMENTVEVERDNDKDAMAADHMMDAVYDLIVKGPADTLEFQRDFVAEAMDMLNSYVADSGISSK